LPFLPYRAGHTSQPTELLAKEGMEGRKGMEGEEGEDRYPVSDLLDTPGTGSETGVDAPSLFALPGGGKSTCGAHGGRTLDGSLCAQPVWPPKTRCLWHPAGLDEAAAAVHRSEMARRGGLAALTPKRLEGRAGDPDFSSTGAIVAWCALMAGKVGRGEFTDYKALDAQTRLARLALDSLGVAMLDSLAELEQLVRGRLQIGTA